MNEAQLARTEAAFREVNEAIAATAARFDAEETDFLCECSDPDCMHRVTLGLEVYEAVRSEPTRFLLAGGHHEPAVEQVVARTPQAEVVDKVAPEAARVARALDPRSS